MANYYISPTGNDSTGDGTSGNPRATITGAVADSNEGDTIICMDGTYTHADNFRVDVGARNVKAENNELAIFDNENVLIFQNGVSDHIWKFGDGSTIIGIKFYRIPIKKYSYGGSAIVAPNANNVTLNVTNCIFEECGAGGISNVAGGVISTIGKQGCTLNIDSNLFLWINSASDANFVFNNISGGVLNTANFTNNTFYFKAKPAEYGDFSIMAGDDRATHAEFTWTNNIFHNETTSIAWYYSAFSAYHTYNYNCAYGNFTNLVAGTGNITSDPLFVDSANDNFNLRPSSPCFDTATLI